MIGIGGDTYYRDLGLSSLKRVAELEKNREQANTALKAQHSQNMMSGAVSGATLGASVGGPYGAAIGLVVGGLAGSFL